MSKYSFRPFFLIVGTLTLAFGCQAQVPNADEQIAAAVSAAPEEFRADATVMGYDADTTLVTLREGSGDLICLSDQPGDDRFHVACYHKSLEPYMARGRALRAEGVGRQESFDIRHQEADEGTLEMPSQSAAVYNLTGDLADVDPETHTVSNGSSVYAVYIPYATAESTGLSPAPSGPGVPWIMRPGTASAHIMIIPAQ
ncbi:MAG TPA: hypothetical protein VKP65_13040 [Rhodothermales bacterium]|nr:hypothetical protein [Rhodothermales bacterium]